jgi:hypothetical protein
MGDERQHRADDGHLRASADYEAPGSRYPPLDREWTPAELAAAATARRLEREEAFLRTTPVTGHDLHREREERERGR